jgi:hypothetical protein
MSGAKRAFFSYIAHHSLATRHGYAYSAAVAQGRGHAIHYTAVEGARRAQSVLLAAVGDTVMPPVMRATLGSPLPEPTWGGAPAGRALAPEQPGWTRAHELEARVEVDGVELVVYEAEWNGAHCCPLRGLSAADSARLEEMERPGHAHYHGYRHGSRDWVITRVATGESLFVPSLTAHMIADHGFFQCSGRYRVDPLALLRVLGMASDGRVGPVSTAEHRHMAADKIHARGDFGRAGPIAHQPAVDGRRSNPVAAASAAAEPIVDSGRSNPAGAASAAEPTALPSLRVDRAA